MTCKLLGVIKTPGSSWFDQFHEGWGRTRSPQWLPDIYRLIILSELGFIWNCTETIMVCCVPLWIKPVIVVTMFSCWPILGEATLIGDLIHLFNSPGILKYPCICTNRWRPDSTKCLCTVRQMIEWIHQTWVFLSVALSSLYWYTYLRQCTSWSGLSNIFMNEPLIHSWKS